jgi:hypothetical protein
MITRTDGSITILVLTLSEDYKPALANYAAPRNISVCIMSANWQTSKHDGKVVERNLNGLNA